MFMAQLAQFLLHHHHAGWAHHLLTMSPHRFAHVLHWARRHGFRYTP